MTAPNLYIPAWVFEAGPHVERAEVFVNPKDLSGLVRVHPETDLLTRALQALERALEDSQEVINARVDQYGESYRAEKLQRMRDDLAAGERVAEELRAAIAAQERT